MAYNFDLDCFLGSLEWLSYDYEGGGDYTFYFCVNRLTSHHDRCCLEYLRKIN